MKITDGDVSLSVDRIPPWTDEYVRETRVTMSGSDQTLGFMTPAEKFAEAAAATH